MKILYIYNVVLYFALVVALFEDSEEDLPQHKIHLGRRTGNFSSKLRSPNFLSNNVFRKRGSDFFKNTHDSNEETDSFLPSMLPNKIRKKAPNRHHNKQNKKQKGSTKLFSNLPKRGQIRGKNYKEHNILEKMGKIRELAHEIYSVGDEAITDINKNLMYVKNLLEYNSRRSVQPFSKRESKSLRRSLTEIDNTFKNRIKHLYYNTSDHDLPKTVKSTMKNMNEMKYMLKYNYDKSAVQVRLKLIENFEDLYKRIVNEIPLLKSFFEEKISRLLPLHLELDLSSLLKSLGIESVTACYVCRNGLEYVWNSRHDEVLSDYLNQQIDPFIDLASKICTTVYPLDICIKMINLQKDVIYYVLDHSKGTKITKENGVIEIPPIVDSMCYLLLQGMEGECGSSEPLTDWHVKIKPKPKYLNYNHATLNYKRDITVAQITDIHYDKKYKPGTPTYCPGIICCREDVEVIENIEPAGEFGSVGKCDIPLSLVQSALQDIEERDVNYVIFTGDIVAHNIWDTSKESNAEDIQIVLKQFRKHFKNTPVYPILGNHDIHPLNIFAPRSVPKRFSSQWLYNLISEIWPKLIFPNKRKVSKQEIEEVTRTIRDGGYYTLKTKENIRIISLNNNLCYKFNWWLGTHARELLLPQLQWLANTLHKAEKHDELVHILLHVPPALSECSIGWIYEYQRIVDRYSHVIRGQFCGHTHYEELHFLEGKDDHIVGAVFNGGSLTTYRSTRPNYRIYDIDKHNANIKEFTTYTMPLDMNIEKWVDQYRFAELFEVPDLTLKSMEIVYEKLINNTYLRAKYINMKYKDTNIWGNRPCDKTCQNEEISQILVPYPREQNVENTVW